MQLGDKPDGTLSEDTLEIVLDVVDAQLDAVSAERERIAGEIHDDPVQAMAAVAIQLQRLQLRLGGRDPETTELLDGARRLTESAIDRLRHMLFTLHPEGLEEDGLAATLDDYLATYGGDTVSHSVVVANEVDLRTAIPIGVSAMAFRLAREAIANAVRHGDPRHIGVRIAVVSPADSIDGLGACLSVEVTDDGCGFSVDRKLRRSGHLGLAHHKRLAEAAMGSLEVHSVVGSGTVVTVTLPLPEPL